MRRIIGYTIAGTIAALIATPVLAQDASRPFSASAQTQGKACSAARADAQAWVQQGKTEGRRRMLVQVGECACTTADARVTCRIDAQVRDEPYEEEEEN